MSAAGGAAARVAEQRVQAQALEAQKLQAVGQLAGGIAHDFNNLLAAIMAAAELIRDRAGVDAATREDAAAIIAAAGRGAALVRQLLAFGRRQELRPRVIGINAAISALAVLLRRVLGPGVRVVLDLSREELLARVDPTQFDQVLLNLAMNAAAAMSKAGTGAGELHVRSGHVTLFRELARGPEVIPPGRYVMVEVRDSGPGIPAEVMPRIFEPFFTTRREEGGTGLGLSTVHGIVRQSGGFIGVDSPEGGGARFRVYLPREDAMEGAAEVASVAAAEPARAPGSRGRLLVLVDDDDAVRGITAKALARDGWEVDACDSGESALEVLRRKVPAVLVSDVLMPGMDGAELARAARALHPGLPVLLVSGYSEARPVGLWDEGKIAFLAKPYALSALRGALTALVDAAVDGVAAAD